MIKSIVFFLTILFSAQLLGSNPFVNYSTRDGLASNVTKKIIQDQNGYIWIASYLGLSRFDGKEFKNYTIDDGLPRNEILDIYLDNEGRLWLSFLDYQPTYIENGKVKKLELTKVQEEELKDFTLRRVKGAKNNKVLFFYHAQLIYELDTKSLEFKKLRDYEEKERYMPVFEFDSSYGYLVSSGSRFLPTNKEPGIPRLITGIKDRELVLSKEPSIVLLKKLATNFVEKKDKLYFNLYPDSALYTIKSDSIIKVLELPNSLGNSFGVDQFGDFWIGLNDNGVWIYDSSDFSKPPKKILEEYTVTSRLIDREGNAWYSTASNGIIFSPNENIEYIKIQDYDANQIRSFIGVAGKLFFSTDTRNAYQYGVGQMLLGGVRINSIIPDSDSTLYISSEDTKKTWKYNSKTKEYSLVMNYGSEHIVQTDSITYASFRRRIYLYKNGNLDFIQNRAILKYIYAITRFKDKIFFGTDDGVYFLTDESYEPLIDSNSQLSGKVNSLINVNDEILIVSILGKGLLFYKDGQIVETINAENGLNNNYINGLYMSKDLKLYSYGKGGFTQIVNYKDPQTIRLENYKSIDGIGWEDILSMYIFEDTVYLAARNGISRLKVDDLKLPKVKPETYISKVSVNQKLIDHKQLRSLKYNENNIEISFHTISYRSLNQFQYNYRLNGGDWISTKLSSIAFPLLSRGDYLLEVESVDPWGQKSEITTLFFEINPPFWLEWWFVLLELSLLGILTYLFIRWRIRNLNQKAQAVFENFQSKHLALNAQLNPHFIFNSLNSIDDYVVHHASEEGSNYLKSFARLMRQTMENSKTQLVSLTKDLALLDEYIRLEMLRFNTSINYQLTIEDNIDPDSVFIPPMILQPYVENSIQHAWSKDESNKELKIRISNNNLNYIIELTDNGVGINHSKRKDERDNQSYHSSGMKISNDRVELFNKLYEPKIEIFIREMISNDDKVIGTMVQLILPLSIRIRSLNSLRS